MPVFQEIKIRQAQKLSGGAANELLVLDEIIGPCILKMVNANNLTTQCTISAEVCHRSQKDSTTAPTLALFHKEVQRDVQKDIGWEGELEIGEDQVVRANFEDTAASDDLRLTVGYIPK